MKALTNFTLLIFILLFASKVNAQLIQVPLDYKKEQSKLIIEGKVIEQHSFEADDGEIYTENIIEIFSIIKGELNSPYLSIITMGGRTDRYEVTWTHLATLKKNQQGVFFLIPTERPSDSRTDYVFELFSSSQGFYEVFKDDDGYKINSPFIKFENPKDFYQKLGVSFSAINGSLTNSILAEDACVVFKIVVNLTASNLQESTAINANIYMKLNEGLRYLYKSNFIVKYSGDFFGQNVVASGNLTFAGGELVTPSYDLLMTDFENDKLEVKLDGLTTNPSQLEQVGTDFRHLASVQMNLIGWSNDTPLEWNPNDGNTSNLYVEANTELIKAFECAEVIVEESGPLAGPEITSFAPNIAAAGVKNNSDNVVPILGVVTITGTEFGIPAAGEARPDGYYVKFETLGGSWIAPLEGDYISWTETEIQVRVPSIGYDNNSDDIIEDFNTDIACTGRIRVCRDGLFNCGMFSTTDDDLYIPFSARNTTQTNQDGELEAVRTVLLNFVDGGYKTRYEPSVAGVAGALGAYTRALSTWRCATRVNFDSDNINPPAVGNGLCRVRFSPLAAGVTSTTRGQTSYLPVDCDVSPFIDFSFLPDFRMTFNSNINWHTGEDMPADLNWDGTGTIEADLESTALHEIGHAHMLNHTCNNANVMISPGPTDFSRNLTIDDENGGNHLSLLSNSILDPDCPDPITPPIFGMELIDLAECDILLSSELNAKLSEINIYPNPTSEKLIINFGSRTDLHGNIRIFDSVGKIIISEEVDNNSMEINLKNVPSGIYHIVYIEKSGENYFIGNILKH